MSSGSKIEWTDHTFNAWWGCARVSPACENCYAEAFAKRVGFGGSKPSLWGVRADRRPASESYWRQPLKWDRDAKKAGKRAKVFCASMADVFEDRRDLDEYRARLWKLIEQTENLDWLLLTKRPEHIASLLPPEWREVPRPNVWLGTTAENQRYADERIPTLLAVRAAVHFASCEPLLGPLDLSEYVTGERRLSWVIVGGESGGGARPMQPEWLRSVRDQVVGAGIPLHFKQWGQFDEQLVRLRKKDTRVLDGRTWDQFPSLSEPVLAMPDPDPVVDLTGVPIDLLLAEIRHRASH